MKTKQLLKPARDFGYICEPRYYFFGWTSNPNLLARSSALQQLGKAKRNLPKGYNFKLWDGYRTFKTQELMHRSFSKRIKLLYPSLTVTQRSKITKKFSGGLVKKIQRLDTHRNGGSFDLTIVDRQGNELYMGSDHDDLTARAATNYYETKSRLKPSEVEARRNRRLLIRVMKRAGFINYAAEWWHWSYNK